jgi:hypothetical protein
VSLGPIPYWWGSVTEDCAERFLFLSYGSSGKGVLASPSCVVFVDWLALELLRDKRAVL